MTVLAVIKADLDLARKNRSFDKAAKLATLFSEASMVGKNKGNRESTDAEVFGVINQFVANLTENIETAKARNTYVPDMNEELEWYKSYQSMMPASLTDDELRNAISTAIVDLGVAGDMKSMGKVMSVLKEKYSGRYDGTVASKMVRESLSK